jgi:hypothetical protein
LDTPLPVEQHERREGNGLVPVPLLLHETGFARAVGERLILEGAFATLVAHRTIQRVVDQQELEDPILRLLDGRRIGDDLLTVRHSNETGGIEGEAPRALHVDQTHAAHANGLHARVVAEAGDVYTCPLGRRDDHLTLERLDRPSVQDDRQLVRSRLRRHRGRRLP